MAALPVTFNRKPTATTAAGVESVLLTNPSRSDVIARTDIANIGTPSSLPADRFARRFPGQRHEKGR